MFWILAFALGLALAGKADYDSRHVKYFRYIRHSADHRIEGRYPMTGSLAKKTYSYRFSYGFDGKLKKVERLWRGSLTTNSDRNLGAAQVLFIYDQDGETRIFRNAPGQPPINQNGVSSERLQFDQDGRPVSVSYLDQDGRPLEDNRGVAKVIWTPDQNGWPARSIRLDLSGRRICDKEGYCAIHNDFDPRGRILAYSNRNEEKKLVADLQGIAREEYFYDGQDNRTQARLYGADGRLSALVLWAYDQNGNLVKKSFWDSKGRLREDNGACAIERMQYDDNGNRVEEECLGRDQKFKAWPDGAAIRKNRYSSDGRWLSSVSLDAASQIISRRNHSQKAIELFPESNSFMP
jgi:hypothetical protein